MCTFAYPTGHCAIIATHMTITLIILALTVGMFIWGRVRSDIVALAALAVLLVLGILTPGEALAGFSSPIVVMMAGLFVVGGAVLQTGLARSIGQRLMTLSHGNETLTFLLLMLVTSVIGAFVSNTGTVALMMPIVISMAAQAGFQSSRMLMPLALPYTSRQNQRRLTRRLSRERRRTRQPLHRLGA